MGAFIQNFGGGSITKNQNGSYNFEKDGKVVSTHDTVKELVEARLYKPSKKSKKETKVAASTDEKQE